jgi:hypothetical protein
VFGASQRAGGGRLVVLSVLAALGVGGPAASALAKPPAPGAPGAVHTWAPADKHGFGTSHQLASKTHFTLRAASLTEVYFPDLDTPSFRGLQFAVTDGATFLDRETVDDDSRHIEPLAPGVTGLRFPPGDPAALADAVARLLGDQVLGQRLVREARETLARDYTWDAIARRTATAYERAVREERSLRAGLVAEAKVPLRVLYDSSRLLATGDPGA